MAGIRVVKWQEWQGRAVYELERRRKSKGRPLSLDYVAISTRLRGSRDFLRFAKLVGTGADAYFLRLLQYVGDRAARSGTVHLEPEEFGPEVLSVPWHRIGAAAGARVFRALLDSGLCTTSSPGELPFDGGPPPTSGEPEGPTESSQGVTAEHDAADAAGAGAADAGRDGDLTREGERTPPSPPSGGGVEPPPEGGGTAAAEAPVPPSSPPSVGSPPSPGQALVEALETAGCRLHGRGGVGRPTWRLQLAPLDGVVPPAEVLAAVLKAGEAAKPWEVLKPLYGRVGKPQPGPGQSLDAAERERRMLAESERRDRINDLWRRLEEAPTFARRRWDLGWTYSDWSAALLRATEGGMLEEDLAEAMAAARKGQTPREVLGKWLPGAPSH